MIIYIYLFLSAPDTSLHFSNAGAVGSIGNNLYNYILKCPHGEIPCEVCPHREIPCEV